MSLRVSVVIATHERPQLLLRCVRALLHQNLPAHDYEIVIVDDGSGEVARTATLRALTSLGGSRGRPSVRYLHQARNRGPAAARNVGWRTARAPIIAFTDDDTLPHPDWLREGLRAVSSGADAVAGRIEVPLPDAPTDYERDAAGLAHAEFATANCFVRRDALEAVGGFDERFRSAWREDTDLEFSLRAHGAVLGRSLEACVVHPVRPAGFGVSLRQQRKVMFDALLYKKFPGWYRAYIRPRPPLAYYAMVAGGLSGLIGAALGWLLLAVAGLGTWLVLAARFALQRLAGTSRAPRHVAEMLWTSLWIPWLSVYWRVRGALRYRVWFV
ncbi:MAG TPA: glycosyltransferase [Casimicrobiaceae bacterium]|nr:glycosyltransferase [Casimicrobiaceae bacterium]